MRNGGGLTPYFSAGGGYAPVESFSFASRAYGIGAANSPVGPIGVILARVVKCTLRVPWEG